LQQQITTQVAQATAGASSSSVPASNSKVFLPKIRQPSAFTGNVMGLAIDRWLSEIEQQFAYYSQSGGFSTDAQRIQYAAAYFNGIAHQWWETQSDRGTLNDWSAFVERLHTRFRPVQAAMIARQQLDKLRMREGTSVNSYISHFHSITIPIQDMNENDRIHAFARGLTQRLATKVWERNPSTLQEAIDYAVMAEATGIYAYRGSHPSYTNRSTSSGPHMGSAPMEVNNFALDEQMPEEQPIDGDIPAAAPTGENLMEAMIQAAVEQRINAMMSNFKPGGNRSFSKGNSSNKNHIPGLKAEEISKLMRENRCFRCKQVGHRKDDPKCPKNQKSKNE
jgi:hypothetical protein